MPRSTPWRRRRRPLPTPPVPTAGTDQSAADDEPAVDPTLVSRRALLGRGGAAAAGVAAGAAATVVASAGPAAAANGSNLVIGQVNTGTNTTHLQGSGLNVSDPVSKTCYYASASSGTQPIGFWASLTGTGARGVESAVTGTQSYGVRGTTYGGTFGVVGSADGTGHGVGAYSDQGPAYFAYTPAGPVARLFSGAVMPPSTGSWEKGDLVNGNQGLWLCIATGVGSASKWIRLSRVFQPLDVPVRVYDSRAGFVPGGVVKGKLLDSEERVIDLTVGGAVPAGIASAVVLNIAVTNTSSGGFVSAFKNGIAWPGTASINWSTAGATISNAATVTVDAAGKCKVRCAGSTDLIIDVTGYFT